MPQPPTDTHPGGLEFCSALNAEQLRAVQHPPHIPLQILAGPGSGKTKVLTSRIAYLIRVHGIPPQAICAVTFTNKAANEMKERLAVIIGEESTKKVRLGTFHALCAMFLRKWPEAAGLQKNFTICDAEESKRLISKFLKSRGPPKAKNDEPWKEGLVLSFISTAKATGVVPEDILERIKERKTEAKKKKEVTAEATIIDSTSNGNPLNVTDEVAYVCATIFEDYERILRANNALDFDDLLVYGVKLFGNHPAAVTWCEHVLVDEFQDTNTMQYALMRSLVSECSVSVVGDPDQSIYGWRAADVKNLSKMRRDFPGVEQIVLEQNYRSTASILSASIAIVSEDKTRIQKTLRTSHPPGFLPSLLYFPTEREEAAFIGSEIKRLIAYTGGLLTYSDFAILLRFNALSLGIEGALRKQGIPSKTLGGHKFFERMEVKDLLAYLQIIDNPRYDPAMVRAISTPTRGIGEKSLSELFNRAERLNLSLSDVIERIHDGDMSDIKPSIKQKVKSFVTSIRRIREQATNGDSPDSLLRNVIKSIQYEEYLKKSQADFELRWENVQALITFATEADQNATIIEEPGSPSSTNTPLRNFLQASMLSTEGDSAEAGEAVGKVTISTCHAAKGLEWPIVIIPAVEKGTYPFYRSEDTEEERRLLYVACTRGQGLLYLTRTGRRKTAGEWKPRFMSEFVSAITKREENGPFSTEIPNLLEKDRIELAALLGRQPPDEREVTRTVNEWLEMNPQGSPNYGAGKGDNSNKANNMGEISQTPKFKPVGNIMRTQSDVFAASSNSTAPVDRLHPLLRNRTPSQNIPPLTRVALPPPYSSNNTTVTLPPPQISLLPLVNIVTKRRLGMGRGPMGYPNKKFKPPT